MKIVHKRKECIGCGACTIICPKFWKIDGDKVRLDAPGVNYDPNTEEAELETDDISCHQDAADVCPVNCILIKKE